MAVRFIKALFPQHAVKRVDLRPECYRESPVLMATASFLLFLSFVLPFIGGLAEAAHLAPPVTDGGVLFGIILGAIARGVIGLSLVGKSSLRVKSFLSGLLCVLGRVADRCHKARRNEAPGYPSRSGRLLAWAGGRDQRTDFSLARPHAYTQGAHRPPQLFLIGKEPKPSVISNCACVEVVL
jgi:hypothetical protein